MLRNVQDLFLDKCPPGSLAGDTSRCALGGRWELGQAGAVGFIWGAGKLVRILFPCRHWKREALGEQ